MSRVFAAAIAFGLLAGLVVAVGRLLTADDGPRVSASNPSPTASVDLESARAVAERFAKAWSGEDLPGMFLLLTGDAQSTAPYRSFASDYETFATEWTLSGLSASVQSVSGTAATVAVRLSTAYFGQFEYTIRLNLAQTNARWGIVWDRTAIHPEMNGGRFFRSAIQRPSRAAILDRDGLELAVTRDVRMLGLNRAVINDRAALSAALVAFGFTAAEVDAAFASPAGATQRVPVGPIPEAKAQAASALPGQFPGVIVYFESQRVHPLGAAAAHVVGYTRELTAEELRKRPGEGLRAGDRAGATGIEAAMNPQLGGQVGYELRLVEPDGITTVRTLKQREFIPGAPVTTTLDAAVLRKSHERLAGRAGAIVVLDPRTNALLALNSSPSFEPDAFERNDAEKLAVITSATGGPLTNRATHGLYSAGSTFKLFTAAAGFLYGGFKPSDEFWCGALWDGVDPPRRNWEGTQGALTIAEGLMRSCNPVFYEIGLQLYNTTENALSKTARLFGFGAPTGISALAEEDGLVPDAAWKEQRHKEIWYPGDDVNLAIGQGALLITPVQLANAYSAFLANELRTLVTLKGEIAASRGAIPLTAEQQAHLRLGLRLVTTTAGTARAAFADLGYTDFAGKSGTAEDIGQQQHVLFVALSPAATPRALAAVVLDEGQSGSIEAGPIARDVVLAALAAE
ncbi:MAG: penicillin-binding transpeptidase domain-containing protein [Dehalococcoidia bacterium]